MAAKYCVCGGKTEYTAKVPTFCSSCGQPFGAAFAKATTTTPITPYPPVVSKVLVARPVSRGPSPESQEGEETDQYDEHEMMDMAHQLAASLSASDFFSAKPAEDNRYRVGDVLDKTKNVHVGQRGGVVADPSQLPRLPE